MNKPERIRLPWEPETSKGKTKRHRFYGTAQWQKIRLSQLSRRPLCEECQRNGVFTSADTVDHIKPVNQSDPYDLQAGRYGHPTDFENLQSLCRKCHAVKTGKERKQ